MKQFFNKIGKTMAVFMVSLATIFSVAAPMVSAENILDKIEIDGSGNLQTGDLGASDTANTFNTLYTKYKSVLNGVIGLVTITLVLLFVIQCAKLGAASDNAAKRSSSVSALLWIGISAGLLGAVYTFIGLFYNLFH